MSSGSDCPYEGAYTRLSKRIDRVYALMKERDRLAALGQMAAGLAHEIKNPLGSIKGAAQFLLEGGLDASTTSASRDFLDIIIEEVDRLDRVVGSVLDYARPSKGNPSPTDINAVVRRTMQILSSAVTEGLTMQLLLQDDLPAVSVDAEQLRQVLMNLVHNGLQAMGTAGMITISTRSRRAPAARWQGGPKAGEAAPIWVELSVKDTGQGISPKILSNLFVPFFSTKSKGTGLGLAISQRIVQAAGGTIEVATQVGAGSTFSVVLPAADETSASLAPSPRAAEVQLASSAKSA